MQYATKRILVPCAVTWTRNPFNISIDPEHPHAEELEEITIQILKLDNMDDENWKGDRLFARVKELAGEYARTELWNAWMFWVKKWRTVKAKRAAEKWWADNKAAIMDSDIEGADMNFLEALYDLIVWDQHHNKSAALSALFLYSYQCGQKARNAAETEEPAEN